MPIPAKAWTAFDADSPLRPWSFERRDPGPDDVVIAIKYCGVCHSDLHFAKNDLGGTTYPLTPGHEIVGVVETVGEAVTRYKAGDRVGVGCLVGADLDCPECAAGEEQFCPNAIGTYGAKDKDSTRTQGGYSNRITVHQHFVLKIPDALSFDVAAPLLCAGITTWSPLRTWRVGKGSKVGVVGLGGLGHMAVKLAVALGAEVAVISTSPSKREDAFALGAHDFLVSTDSAQMKAAENRFDLIIDTVAVFHEPNPLLRTLSRDGTLVLLGLIPEPLPVKVFSMMGRRRRLAASPIGGIRETQEVLDFCAEHGVAPEIEVIRIDQINEAYERMVRSDVRYRFVIDMATI